MNGTRSRELRRIVYGAGYRTEHLKLHEFQKYAFKIIRGNRCGLVCVGLRGKYKALKKAFVREASL